MKQYVIKRLLMLIPVLLGSSILVFILIHIAPGEPAQTMVGEWASEEMIEMIRERYGLDKPLPIQYFIWFKRAILQFDMGRSIVSKELVSKEIMERLPNTIELTMVAMILAIILGGIAGIISASRQYSVIDYTTMVGALFGVSMPVFWLGIMLMMVFGVYLRWLPIGGRISMMVSFQKITGFYLLDSIITGNWEAFLSLIRHLLLPAIALATIPMATIARITRSSMLEILRQDFIRTQRAKGLSERGVIYKHAVRNALIPVVTVIGMSFGRLLTGALLTETVFSWPGLGRYVITSINFRDYPAVQGCVLFFAFMFVIVNLLTDILYVYIDPRIHYR